jgi:plasmid maintenance system killer protein
MIKKFRHKGLEEFFLDDTLKGIQPKHAQRLGYILDLLDAAKRISDVDFPGELSLASQMIKPMTWIIRTTTRR